MPLSDAEWVKEYYMPEEVEKPVEEEVKVEETPVAEEVKVEETPVPPPVVQTEYKSDKKYIPVEDEEKLYNQLSQKYGSRSLTDEQKALQYLREKNPELDENEIQFLAAQDYGIGVSPIDETELTDEQVTALRKQGIDRKKLFSSANNYFSERSAGVQLETTDPFELDENYKQFLSDSAQRRQQAQAQAQRLQEVTQQIETNAKNISETSEQYEIDIDESKFATDVKFKLSPEKQTQLVDFAKRYQPTDDEVKQFTDPQTGKFDYKGYLSYLSPMAFAREYVRAGIKQGIVNNRDKFIESELKNSTLRVSDDSAVAENQYDPVDDYWNRYAGH